MDTALASSIEQQQRITHSVSIKRPAIALYRAWQDLARRQAAHMEVRRAAEAGYKSNAVIKAPSVGEMSSALLVDHIPGLFLSWQSLPHASVRQTGEVWFHQTSVDHPTEVRVILSWEPAETNDFASLPVYDHARAQIEQDLDRFKQLMEH